MIALFPAGFEETERDSQLELAAYTDAAGEARLWKVFGRAHSETVEPGWSEAWRRFHRPVRIGPLWIGPTWSSPPAGATAVVIDPGQAFGTGAHATTKLCLELLLRQERTSVVDLGCGSGVLAVAAAKLGFSPVTAVDLDQRAVAATRMNALANGVTVSALQRDAQLDPLPSAELALANIALRPVEMLAARVRARRLIMSGYLEAETPRLGGFRHRERRQQDGWAADLFEHL